MKIAISIVFMLMILSASGFAQTPHVVSTSPTQNALSVAVGADITVTFDSDMDETTINSSTVVVNGRSTGLLEGTISYDGPSKTATFNPLEDLVYGEMVAVVLTGGIQSSGGVPLVDYAWSFTIAVDDGSGTFPSQETYSAGDGPKSVFAADFDGDGDIDLATANDASNNISILMNNGDGTFAAQAIYGTGSGVCCIFGADLDSDGDIDLATASFIGHYISVLFNNGYGAFSGQTSYYLLGCAIAVFAADIDGDGDHDLVAADNSQGDVSVFLNYGNGTFAPRVNYDVGGGPTSVRAADLDGDGDFDLAAANSSSDNISILLNNGNGTFATHTTYATGSVPSWIFVADFNGDGNLDLATTNYSSNNISVLLNNGNGIFATQTTYSAGSGPKSIFAADIDGDNDLDLTTANMNSNDISAFLNNGDGTFVSQTTYDSGTTPFSIVAADLDGDGDIDLTTANYDSDNVSVFLNAAAPPQIISTSPAQNELSVFKEADITATFNMRMDPTTIDDSTFIVSGRLSGRHSGTISYVGPPRAATFDPDIDFQAGEVISVILSSDIKSSSGAPLENGYTWQFTVAADDNGPGTLAPPINYGAGSTPFSVFGCDLDSDGDNDLAVANRDSDNISILRNNGDGTYQAAVNYEAGDGPASVFACDLDGDGDNDLAVANYYSGSISVLKNIGDGTFIASVNYMAGNRTFSVISCDIDGDGDNDLAVANLWSTNISVFRNNGDGTFEAPVNYSTGSYPQSIYGCDLDGDGDNDLAVANFGSNNISVFSNNGDGTFEAAVNYGAAGGPVFVFGCDLDGDGDNDLTTANFSYNNISVLKNNGDGTFYWAGYYGAGVNPFSVFGCDLDNDGDNDLAVANFGSNNISILRNNGDGTCELAVNYGTGDTPSSIFGCDLDGDGDNDLTVANSGSDSISVLINRHPNIMLNPTAFDYELNPGDPNPDDQVLVVEADYGTIDFTVSDDADWLTVTPASGTTPESLSVSVDITGLTPGVYTGNIEITSDEADNSPQVVEVTLTIHPSVVSTSPTQNQLNVAANANITVTFDSDMEATTINDSTFVVNGLTTGLLDGTFSYDAPSRTVTFDPLYDFAAGEMVTVVLTPGIQSSLGASLVYYAWAFTATVIDGPGNFPSWEAYSVDSYANTVIAADFDGDTHLDLAVPGSSSDSVSVLLNNGNGTFGARVAYAAGDGPNSIIAVDLDGDGDIDIASSNGVDDSISILLNNGVGTFQAPSSYPTGDSPGWVTAADLDGDGDLDLITADRQSNTVTVISNNGDGSFGSQTSYAAGSYPNSIFASDLDNDADFDLAVTNHSSNDISVFLNNGDGTFMAQTTYTAGNGPNSVFAADLDGDSDIDLMSANNSSANISVLLNNGDGTFGVQTTYPVGTSPWSIFAANFDGDTDLDLVTANLSTNDVSILLNNGNATFAAQTAYPTGSYSPRSVFAADLDDDGDNDLAVVHGGSGIVSVLLNQNTPPPACISGTVTNHDNEGIEGVLVEAIIDDSPAGFDSTDIDGSYEIIDLPSGSYEISFAKEGFYDTLVADVELISGDTVTVDMVLHMPGSYSGIVTDYYGMALPDVHVVASIPPPVAAGLRESKSSERGETPVITDVEIVSETWTDPSGGYTLILDPGIYTVTFDSTGWDTYTTIGFEIALDTVITDQNVFLRRAGSISGTVTDAASSDIINGVHVAVIGDFFFQEDYTDELGQYLIESTYDGDYEIIFSHADYDSLTIDGQHVNDGEELILDVSLNTSGSAYLPGDVNMSAGAWPAAATGPDVTYLVNFFRGVPTSHSCLLGGFWCSADANGDCNIIGSDVTKLVNVFRGIGSIGYCTDYEPAWPTPADLPDEAPVGWPGCEAAISGRVIPSESSGK